MMASMGKHSAVGPRVESFLFFVNGAVTEPEGRGATVLVVILHPVNRCAVLSPLTITGCLSKISSFHRVFDKSGPNGKRKKLSVVPFVYKIPYRCFYLPFIYSSPCEITSMPPSLCRAESVSPESCGDSDET